LIYSEQIIKELEKYQIFPNKTGRHLLNFDIPSEYFWNYVRGYFDADGSAWINSTSKRINSSITCKSNDFLIELKRRCEDIGSINKIITKKNKKTYTLYYWNMGYRDTILFRDNIYKGYNFCLERKRNVMYKDVFIPSSRWWTIEQIEYLKNNYIKKCKKSKEKVSQFVNRSIPAVDRKAYELGLTK